MRGFTATDPARPNIVVIGEGLVGSAVVDRLRRRGGVEWHRPNDWTRPDQLGDDLRSGLDTTGATGRIEIVWSAGTGDLAIDTLDSNAHRAAFTAQISSVLDAAGDGRVHLVSSAGALGPPTGEPRFEIVDHPYATRKRIEEDVLRGVPDRVRIYRVASVYGAPRGRARAGVIGTLVHNAMLGKETSLFARTTTMRNYVLAADVGEAIVRACTDEHDDDSPVLLAAVRSHPMYEVVAHVAQVVRRPVPIAYRPPMNDHDMVFDPGSVSDLLPQRSLPAGIRLVHDALLGR